MPGFLLHVGAQAQCPHVGQATVAPTQMRVQVSTQFVATAPGQIAVAGCPFQIPFGVGTKPQPCVKVQWGLVSTRVLIDRKPVLLQPAPGPGTGPGVCQSIEQIPQGPPVVNAIQQRVMGG